MEENKTEMNKIVRTTSKSKKYDEYKRHTYFMRRVSPHYRLSS